MAKKAAKKAVKKAKSKKPAVEADQEIVALGVEVDASDAEPNPTQKELNDAALAYCNGDRMARHRLCLAAIAYGEERSG